MIAKFICRDVGGEVHNEKNVGWLRDTFLLMSNSLKSPNLIVKGGKWPSHIRDLDENTRKRNGIENGCGTQKHAEPAKYGQQVKTRRSRTAKCRLAWRAQSCSPSRAKFLQNWWFTNWSMLGLLVLGRIRKYYIKKLLQVRKFKAFSSKESTMFIAEPLCSILARSRFDMCIESM